MRNLLENGRLILVLCVISAGAASVPICMGLFQQNQLQQSIEEINEVYAVASQAREVLDVVSQSMPSFTAGALELTEAERDQIYKDTDKYLGRLDQCVKRLVKSASPLMSPDQLKKITSSISEIGHSWEEIRRHHGVDFTNAEKTFHFLKIFAELRDARLLLADIDVRANKATKATIAGAFDRTRNSQQLLMLSLAGSAIVGLVAITSIFGFARATRALNDCLDAAITNMGPGLCMFDGRKRLVVSNDRYATLYGLDPKRVTPGTPFAEILEQHVKNDAYSGQDVESYIRECMRSVEEREPLTKIQQLRDGRYIEIAHRPLTDGGWLATHDDVTVRVETEQEIRQHRDQLKELVAEATCELQTKAAELERALATEQQANQLQRQFVSMASHEFRTPLSIIDTVAQGFQRRLGRLTPEEAGQRLDKIRGAVKRLVRLIESTLMAARMEEGKILVEIEDCDIAQVVSEVCERQQEVAGTHTIRLETIDLPKTIRADRNALDHVVTNLLSNAIKYSPDAPEIDVVACGQGEEIVISVSDRGLGIDEDELPRMFERFFRARTSTGIAGTGIGLNLCQTLVDMHGGTIGIDSRVGKGSTFTVRLPVAGPPQDEKLRQQAA